MKRIEKLIKASLFVAIALLIAAPSNAQCGKFTDASNPSDAETAHVLYRQDMKMKQLDAAYDNWKKAYDMAPAADGARDVHYTDGIKILKHKLKNETDEAKKKTYADQVNTLYDQAITCLESGSVKLPKMKANDRIAYLLGRKAFDMFYELRTPYADVRKTLERAVEKGGNNTEYIVLDPYARIVVHQFTNDLMSKEESRNAHAKLFEIADYNIANNAKHKAYYEQAKASVEGIFAQIENNIFDCEYFVNKLRPTYNADPDNPEVMKEIIPVLKRQGCVAGEPFLDELEKKYEKYAIAENARRQAEFEANNPAFMAKKEYDAGNFPAAIAKYREALGQETDEVKKADYYFRIASIQGRKMAQYGQARTNAYNAAKLRPDWGRPYMLIGDLYAKGSRNCGGDAYTRGLAILAAIDKYRKAKSIDSSVAAEANKRIGNYQKSIPPKEEVFMRGKNGGKTDKVPCWIGETVQVKYN